MRLPKALMNFIRSEFGTTVTIATEYTREEFTFRCHPNYQSDGPIFDWMNVLFDDGTYPCRLAAVIVHANPDIAIASNESYTLLVQSATSRTGIASALFTEWSWSADYYAIDPSSIAGPCFVVSITDDSSKILEALPISEWAALFTDC